MHLEIRKDVGSDLKIYGYDVPTTPPLPTMGCLWNLVTEKKRGKGKKND